MKNTRKILLALLLILTMLVGMTAITASAADEGTTLYLTPNANWKTDNARFAVYYWDNSGNHWVDMTAVEGETNLYSAVIPAGFTNIIFCRMDPGKKTNDWNSKWNQTSDLKVPTNGTNRYTVAEGAWDKGSGSWDIYGTSCKYNEEITLQPTCTEAGSKIITCTTCADAHSEVVAIDPTGHNFGEDGNAEKCSACGIDAYYIVAGQSAICGSNWIADDENNKMSDEDGDGVFEKTYENIPAGTYEVKVVKNGSNWIADSNSEQKDQNHVFTVDALSNVTVKFDSAKNSYSVVATPVEGDDNGESGETPENPGETPDDPENGEDTPVVDGETITVYFRNNWLWSNVSLHFWAGEGDDMIKNSWDGADSAMTFVKNDGVYDIYSMIIPANVSGIVIHGIKDNGSGESDQTPDIVDGIVDGAGWEMYWIDGNTVVPYTYIPGESGDNGESDDNGESGETPENPGETPDDGEEVVGANDYYLIGFINGANYGCDDNWESLGDYKFVDGKVKVTFEQGSYVFIKTGDNMNWYMTDGWLGTEVTTATLYNTNNLTQTDKLFAPEGVELTFTLVVNEDGTLTLSYEAAQSGNTDKPADPKPEEKPEENKPENTTPEQPEDNKGEDNQPEEKLNFFQKIWKAILAFFQKLFAKKN